jgi:hypothetical protein
MSIKLGCAAVAGAWLLLACAPAAQAANPGFCRDYTSAALRQVRAAYAQPRCAAGIGGPRWSTQGRVHYDWCLGADFAATGAERDARTAYLRSCR